MDCSAALELVEHNMDAWQDAWSATKTSSATVTADAVVRALVAGRAFQAALQDFTADGCEATLAPPIAGRLRQASDDVNAFAAQAYEMYPETTAAWRNRNDCTQ